MTAHHTFIDTELGQLTLTSDNGALTGIYFPHHWRKPSAQALGEQVEARQVKVFVDARTQLTDYLAGKRQDFDLPTKLHGDEFHQSVWQLLEQIPYGSTTTYGELAERLGNKALAQAVGRAVGDNPLSIVVPCHRVVGTDGSLTGYAGGLGRKRTLLELEEPEEARSTRLF